MTIHLCEQSEAISRPFKADFRNLSLLAMTSNIFITIYFLCETVRASMVCKAVDYPYSSAAFHLIDHLAFIEKLSKLPGHKLVFKGSNMKSGYLSFNGKSGEVFT